MSLHRLHALLSASFLFSSAGCAVDEAVPPADAVPELGKADGLEDQVTVLDTAPLAAFRSTVEIDSGNWWVDKDDGSISNADSQSIVNGIVVFCVVPGDATISCSAYLPRAEFGFWGRFYKRLDFGGPLEADGSFDFETAEETGDEWDETSVSYAIRGRVDGAEVSIEKVRYSYRRICRTCLPDQEAHESTYYTLSGPLTSPIVRARVEQHFGGHGQGPGAKSFYVIPEDTYAYGDSLDLCSRLNGALFNPGAFGYDSQQKHFWLARYHTARYWIDFTDIANEGTFRTAAGASITRKFWMPGEPNGGVSENCVELIVREDPEVCYTSSMNHPACAARPIDGWNDLDCQAQRVPLCELISYGGRLD